jgi:NAD+ synthase (glutamine-hydrolysing)
MRDARIALAQVAPRLGDLRANLALHIEQAERAREAGAGIVLFPELSMTGYVLRDQVPEVALRRDDPTIRRLARASRGIDLVVGFVEDAPGHRYHNAAAYFSGGRLVHIHHKLYLPTYGLFEEGRDLAPGERLRGFDSPCVGPAGILICEDWWHPTSAWLLAQEGAEVMFGLSSAPTRGARPGRGVTSVAVWHDLLRATAQFQTSYVIYVNRVGYEDGLNFGGGSAVFDPFGRDVLSMPALDEGLGVAELRGDVLRRARTAYPLLRDENLDLVYRELGRIRTLRYDLPPDRDETPEPVHASSRPTAGRRR